MEVSSVDTNENQDRDFSKKKIIKNVSFCTVHDILVL
jgi:hypothetical protein